MNYKESLEYVMNIPRFAKVNTLERVREILSALNNPEQSLRFIHVAGTNGKGSTTTMISSMLNAAGYRVGTFVSPFVYDFLERIQIGMAPVARDTFAAAVSRVRSICDAKIPDANFFEILTATALLIFYEEKCDIVVLEVGLGGRLDATNVIPPPVLAIITTLALDHTALLGETLPEIAAEKCGIIKRDSRVITGTNHPDDVLSVIKSTCASEQARLVLADIPLEIKSESIEKTVVLYNGHEISIPLIGRHQLFNLKLALTAAKELGLSIDAIAQGLSRATLPARLEVKSHHPLTIVDGAHNVNGMYALRDAVLNLLSGRRIVTIFGCMRDKNSEEMVHIANSFSDELILTAPQNPRAAEPEALLPYCNGVTSDNLSDALQKARLNIKDDDVLIICGSLYLASETKNIGNF